LPSGSLRGKTIGFPTVRYRIAMVGVRVAICLLNFFRKKISSASKQPTKPEQMIAFHNVRQRSRL
jgi:hypothetical protein